MITYDIYFDHSCVDIYDDHKINIVHHGADVMNRDAIDSHPFAMILTPIKSQLKSQPTSRSSSVVQQKLCVRTCLGQILMFGLGGQDRWIFESKIGSSADQRAPVCIQILPSLI